eukprot:TRINITY_DN9715_c0_g1_i1.p1 TRINITY_DN9715_c0_g1~~TRINITY_DN9715_c0_g1_i1.p1  ORF type:complete len:164 (+),score=50.77 TRINITY_DN9715_c0_g1_i1:57-548(+)
MLSAIRKSASAAASTKSLLAPIRKYSDFAGSQSHGNLVEAFKAASMARARYAYFAEIADLEGQVEAATALRGLAKAEESISKSHMDFLTDNASDPQTGLLLGSTSENVQSAIAGVKYISKEMYPGMAQAARNEGFEELAVEFEHLAQAQQRFAAALEKVARDL